MLRVAILASGSSGNCAVVSDGRIHILIDAGISAKRIVTGLGELGIGLDADDSAVAALTDKGYDKSYGARPLRRAVRTAIEDPASVMILEGTLAAGDTLAVTAEDREVRLSVRHGDFSSVPG